MWLPTKFYIHKESDNLVEFRENKLKLFGGCVPAVIVSIACILLWQKHNLWQEIIINGAGLTLLYFGIIPLLSKGYLRIDKQNKQLIFKGGFKRLIFSYYKIPFSEINRIEINNELQQTMLEREEVGARLIEMGVDIKLARERVASLTDAEIAVLNERLGELPAGGDVLVVMLIIFLVFIMTDVLGVTDIFPFIHPAN